MQGVKCLEFWWLLQFILGSIKGTKGHPVAVKRAAKKAVRKVNREAQRRAPKVLCPHLRLSIDLRGAVTEESCAKGDLPRLSF
jgi:hypothetical protein